LQSKGSLLLAIYNGGQGAVEASKLLTEMESKPLIEKIEAQKPKVEFADRLLKTKDNILVREFSKVLYDEGFTLGEKKLYKWLREKGFLMNSNEPYQRFMDNNTFKVKVGTIDTAFGIKQTKTTIITPEGQLYLFKKIQEDFIRE
jgi:phage antirepressor YoqD-like protein